MTLMKKNVKTLGRGRYPLLKLAKSPQTQDERFCRKSLVQIAGENRSFQV